MSYALVPSIFSLKVFNDWETVKKFGKEKGVEIVPRHHAGIAAATSNAAVSKGFIVVYFNTREISGIDLLKIIAHESVHVVREIQRRLGMSDRMEEEVEAYMVGQTYEEISRQLIEIGVDLSLPSSQSNK